MNKQNIWFVIVMYKPETGVLRRLMDALKGWSVEVVDNTGKNLGYGAAANRGMKTAFEAGAQWTVVVNQDVRVTRAGITQFCAMAQQCDPCVVGPEAGTLDPKRWTTILASERSLNSEFTPSEVEGLGMTRNVYISGSFMAIHREVWGKVGGFYEPYFMYYEDVDLCVRARKAGFAIRQVEVEGFAHESSGSNKSKEYYLARNHLLFVFRNAPVSVKLRELVLLPKTLWEYFLWS